VIATAEEALALVRERGAATLVPAGDLPSLVEAVAGGRVRGSWWSHPSGRRLYAIGEELGESSEVLVLRRVQGKVTFLHRALWPALLRVVLDGAWRRRARAALPDVARRLLARVERAGEARLDALAKGASAGRRSVLHSAARELEARLLVLSRSVHTERGHHATVLCGWRRWATPALAREAGALDLAEAVAALERVGGAPVTAAARPGPAGRRVARPPAHSERSTSTSRSRRLP